MDLTTWLAAEEGRTASLAAHFGVTLSAISQWKQNGVPLSRMKAVRDFTQGAISLDEMVPAPPIVDRRHEHDLALKIPAEVDRRADLKAKKLAARE